MDAEIRYMICVDNGGYQASLEPLKLYLALPAGEPELGLIRIVDESGEDYLYPAASFVEASVSQHETEALCARLQSEAGKAADAPLGVLPDATRPWLAEAEEYLEENEEVLSDPELDMITNSHLAVDATTRLKEVSGAIGRAQKTKGFPPSQMLQLRKAFQRLQSFSERALNHFEENFADAEEARHSSKDEGTYSAAKEAERVLQELS